MNGYNAFSSRTNAFAGQRSRKPEKLATIVTRVERKHAMGTRFYAVAFHPFYHSTILVTRHFLPFHFFAKRLQWKCKYSILISTFAKNNRPIDRNSTVNTLPPYASLSFFSSEISTNCCNDQFIFSFRVKRNRLCNNFKFKMHTLLQMHT